MMDMVCWGWMGVVGFIAVFCFFWVIFVLLLVVVVT